MWSFEGLQDEVLRRNVGFGWCACDCSESRVEVLTPEGGCLSLAGVDEMRILRGPYLGFGGGGLGTPVVSYAPRPILQELTSMEIIMVDVCRCGSVVLVRKAVCLLKKESGGVPRNQKKKVGLARSVCRSVDRCLY